MEAKTEMGVTIIRVLNAPRELVFKAWTEPKLLAQWWGPRGFTAPVCEADAKVGGKVRIHMLHPQFPNHWTVGEYKEVDRPKKLVFINNAVIAENGVGTPVLEGITTVTFEEQGDKTKLTIHAILTKIAPGMEAAYKGMNQGWNESIDKLEELLA